jgi:hypothetical protein
MAKSQQEAREEESAPAPQPPEARQERGFSGNVRDRVTGADRIWQNKKEEAMKLRQRLLAV